MTSLICLICRCNLKDGRLVKEREPFETDPEEAESLIRGGIAKATEPVIRESVKEPFPVKVVEEIPDNGPVQTETETPEVKDRKKSRR